MRFLNIVTDISRVHIQNELAAQESTAADDGEAELL